MAIYDIDGNELYSGITDEQVRLAFMNALADGTIVIGSQPGDTLGISADAQFNQTYMQTAYASLLSAFKTYPNSVPFFIHSDQHGRGVEIQRYANNIDVDGMEYANINGGDTVVDVYGTDVLEDIYQRIRYVKNYIGIPGNHDYKKGSENISEFQIRRTFCTTNLERRLINTSDLDCYVSYQPIHTVKFICIDPYDSRGIISGMGHPYINTEVADWLITELSRNDGYDIVGLIHEPQWLTYKHRDDANYTTSTDDASVFNLFLARKNHQSGIFVDDENVSHSYDFTNTENDVLCMLSGHVHSEIYSDQDGLTVYAQDWAGNNKYGGTFGLLDRDNNLMRIFSFDSVNGNKTELDLSLQ